MLNKDIIIYRVSLLTKKVCLAYSLKSKLSDKVYIADVLVGNIIETGTTKLINIEDCVDFYITSSINEFNKLNNK